MTDTPRPGEHSSAPSPQARPSLTGQQSSSESVSILSAVTPPRRAEASPVPKGVSSALPWIGVLALIVIGVIFWIELSGGRTPAAAPEVATVTPPAPALTPVPAAVPDLAPAEVATIENEHPVAAIETTPPPVHATASPSPSAPSGTATAAASTAPKETKPSTAVPAGKSAVASAESASGQRSPFAAMEPAATPRKAKPTAPAAPTGNSDVDLLQALLSVTPQQNRGTAAAPAPRTVPKAVAKPAPVPVVKETSRDVVERDPVISTGDLLKRCDKLGVLEAVLCKTRICSGLWGRDSACPVTNDPAYKKG